MRVTICPETIRYIKEDAEQILSEVPQKIRQSVSEALTELMQAWRAENKGRSYFLENLPLYRKQCVSPNVFPLTTDDFSDLEAFLMLWTNNVELMNDIGDDQFHIWLAILIAGFDIAEGGHIDSLIYAALMMRTWHHMEASTRIVMEEIRWFWGTDEVQVPLKKGKQQSDTLAQGRIIANEIRQKEAEDKRANLEKAIDGFFARPDSTGWDMTAPTIVKKMKERNLFFGYSESSVKRVAEIRIAKHRDARKKGLA